MPGRLIAVQIFAAFLVVHSLGGCRLGEEPDEVTVYELFFIERSIKNDESRKWGVLYKKAYRLADDKVALKMDSNEPMWLSDCVIFNINNWTCKDPLEGKIGFNNGKWVGQDDSGRKTVSEWEGVFLECKSRVLYPNDPEILWSKCWKRLKEYIM